MSDVIEIVEALSGPDLEDVRTLFLEYADSLNFSLCFQDFDAELSRLPGQYAPPKGRLYLCRVNGEPAGCIAVKPLDESICEMKRLYVRPAFRGRKIGLLLALRLINDARRIGYRAMRLDTIASMERAMGLYRSLGFKEIPPYYENPIPNAVYFELEFEGNWGQ
jgi:ribosomal protein S18 acetylase RimI-like enzyme